MTYLSIASLESKMEETSNTILCGSWRVVHDETKAKGYEWTAMTGDLKDGE